MVDMEKVKERLIRGGMVGAGAFSSGFIGGALENQLGVGDLGASVGQVGVGLGVSLGADYVFDPRQEQMLNDAIEFAGYGIEGAGFANLGSAITEQVQTGAGAATGAKVVEISADAGRGTAQEAGQIREEEDEEFALDV